MRVQLDTNASEISRWILRLNDDQMPFAVSLALNSTAFDLRDEQREEIESRFTVRRSWVPRGVQVADRATKTKHEAVVHLAPDRDFLARFEEGGRVTPERSRAFAVPQEARRTTTGVIRKSERPRAFQFEEAGRGQRATVYRGRKGTFMIRRHDGEGLIAQRQGRGASSRVRVLFTFTGAATLPADLRFELTAERVLDEKLVANFERAFDRALRTAR